MHSLAFGFHIYVIYTTKRLDAQRNKQTIRDRSLSSFKMQSQSHEFSYFLNCEKDLESLAEDYSSTRPAEAEDDQLTTVLTAATKLIRKLTPMLTLTFRSVIYLRDRKCTHLRPKHVDVLMEITQIHAALPLK